MPDYTVSAELQAFLAGLGGKAVRSIAFYGYPSPTGDRTTTQPLPSNPDSTRTALLFSKFDSDQYGIYIANVDGTSAEEIILPR